MRLAATGAVKEIEGTVAEAGKEFFEVNPEEEEEEEGAVIYLSNDK